MMLRLLAFLSAVTLTSAFGWYISQPPAPEPVAMSVVQRTEVLPITRSVQNAEVIPEASITYNGIAGSSTGTVVYAVATLNTNAIVTWTAPARDPSRFALSCSEDSCEARGVSMDQAREMLERIANRGITIDIAVDQNCHVRHEVVQPRAPEVASLDR